MEQAGTGATDAEAEAVAKQHAALAALKALPKGASVVANRLARLECQLADFDVALIRIPRGPKTARLVGKLRKQRATADSLIRELRAIMLAKK
ncbi:MAG: hypothetical protein EKK53_27875 [Burkholderiales bacterium]|jgi:hypothetical protein|nr:MAG: hypothetical protein EKK53_27875 [Burkholderiales bacterium]